MTPKLRKRVLSEWLGFSFSSSEPRTPVDLRGTFQKAFAQLGLAHRFQESTLLEHWLELVGPTLSAHCQPRNIRRGILTITVDHPAWVHQITLAHKADMLHAIQNRFPHLKVKEITLRIG